MDLELTDEQVWLGESIEQLLSASSADEVWPALVDFGVLTIASGGEGLGAVELALVARALGASLASVPFIDTVAARYATRPLASHEPAAFGGVHGTDGAVSLCLLDPGGGWELTRCTTAVTNAGEGASVIEGRKMAVHHAQAAARMLVLYRDGAGRRLGVIDHAARGVAIAPASSIDDSIPTATVTLEGVPLPAAASLPAEESEDTLARLLAIGAVLAAGEAVGAAGTLVELARDYAVERRQFGRPIGSFQALRHLLADIHVKQTSAWSTVLFAAAALEDGIDDARLTASIAKAYASRATLEAAHGALQVFAGIAFTAEHPAHRYLRRILVRGGQFGDARHHERLIGRALASRVRAEELVG
jgi:alkylation response protein AidB-like acyl-CoA dehydrogenase